MVVVFVVYTALLFGAAGTLRWPQAWLYVAVLVLVLAWYVAIVSVKHPDLIEERARPPADAKRWDRPLVAIVAGVGPLAMLLAAGVECRQRGGPGEFSATPWAGALLVGAGGALANWAVAANRFFSGLVRIQHDRGHHVVDSGPYAWVRHPGYAGSLLNNFGAAAALQSWWALQVALVLLVVTVLRTSMEDRTLRAELDGYEDYATRVRFRLVPGIW
jgi:protein-S-isoprenylcysteine O-methyltransferase Ste14